MPDQNTPAVVGTTEEKSLSTADTVAAIKKYTPKGQSPKVYYKLISDIMGVDKQGKERPFTDVLSFMYVCSRTGLDPILRQIYAVYRWDYKSGKERMVIQTGIDGMRLTAQRSNEYAGQDDIKFTPEDEATKYPVKATCTVYKNSGGQRVGFTATARWSEYAQYNGQVLGTMWEKMPYNQLGKCAEALALRKGFPNELSGVYAEEEMQQANTNVVADLPIPDKFASKIEVVHGAADDASNKPVEGSIADVKVAQGGTVEAPPPPPAAAVVETKASKMTEEIDAKLARMREKNKERLEAESKAKEGDFK